MYDHVTSTVMMEDDFEAYKFMYEYVGLWPV